MLPALIGITLSVEIMFNDFSTISQATKPQTSNRKAIKTFMVTFDAKHLSYYQL